MQLLQGGAKYMAKLRNGSGLNIATGLWEGKGKVQLSALADSGRVKDALKAAIEGSDVVNDDGNKKIRVLVLESTTGNSSSFLAFASVTQEDQKRAKELTKKREGGYFGTAKSKDTPKKQKNVVKEEEDCW